MDAAAIFQRTESGRSEIKNKMHGLTQSERLALIVIDGVSSYGELRQKLKGLSEERFERALSKLQQKNLIFEVLLPVEDAAAEVFDARTIDQFLHQDPLDPVTIMAIDPEEEFDLDMSAEGISSPQFKSQPVQSVMAQSAVEVKPPTRPVEMPAEKSTSVPSVRKPLKIASVDFYVPLEKPGQRSPVLDGASEAKMTGTDLRDAAKHRSDAGNPSPLFSEAPARKFAWGSLAMIGGLILIIMSLVFGLKH